MGDNCYIVVNYKTYNECQACILSILKVEKYPIIIVINNIEKCDFETFKKYHFEKFCQEKNIIIKSIFNIGYGRALNHGIEISKIINRKINYYFLMNADVEIIEIPKMSDCSGDALIPIIINGTVLKKTIFMNMLNRRFTILIARHKILKNNITFFLIIAIQKIIIYIKSKPYTTHGSLFIIKSKFIDDNLFNSNTFLYSEELEFGEYLLRRKLVLKESKIIYRHIGSASIKFEYPKLTNKIPLFRDSLNNWFSRWFC